MFPRSRNSGPAFAFLRPSAQRLGGSGSPIDKANIDTYLEAKPTETASAFAGSQIRSNGPVARTGPSTFVDYHTDAMLVDDLGSPESVRMSGASKNAHLRGRKRFNADLADIKEECAPNLEIAGLRVRNFRPGDDEGSFEFKVFDTSSQVVAVTMMVSDTSEYPDHHSYLAFCSDCDVPPAVTGVIEKIASGKPREIRNVLDQILTSLSRVLLNNVDVQAQNVDCDESSEDGMDYDELEDFGIPLGIQALQTSALQRDFIDAVATGYRPGLLRFGNDFALSVAFPVIKLARDISPQALMAWDRRLLSRSQYLTLLINGWKGVYPIIRSDGIFLEDFQRLGATLSFRVGLTKTYKPSKEHAVEEGRTFALVNDTVQDGTPIRDAAEECEDMFEGGETEDEEALEKFSLSSSLESLLDNSLLKVVQLRRKFGLGWAGAETLLSKVEGLQTSPETVFTKYRTEIDAADKEETVLASSYRLPFDPLAGRNKDDELNLPLIAFCFLVRRLTLCTRYCIVCHNKVTMNYEVLKPYICDSDLCAYQYYCLGRGPSLEYEIRANPETVDLLVSLAYNAAAEGVMDKPLPTGLGLRVPLPDSRAQPGSVAPLYLRGGVTLPPADLDIPTKPLTRGRDGLYDFDAMNVHQMRASIAELVNSLPPVTEMKKHLEKKVKAGKVKPKLKDMDPAILPAAWLLLRWCVGSCTAHLEELTDEKDRVRNIPPQWRQFRFSVGAPDAETKFKAAVAEAQGRDANAKKFPSLYAFHGSPIRNWHSIVRHGLWYKTVTHGRAYGDGVYLAKDASVSMSSYTGSTTAFWKNSRTFPSACVALAEIVNLPNEFRSANPFFVVQHTTWIMCRYLLVRASSPEGTFHPPDNTPKNGAADRDRVPMVALDPKHQLKTQATHIEIPRPDYMLETIVKQRIAEYQESDNDDVDRAVFDGVQENQMIVETDNVPSPPPKDNVNSNVIRAKGDWKHDAAWVKNCVQHLLPPPVASTPTATMALQRELRAILREQRSAPSLRDLGWYMPEDFIGDNLFQWIVELHSFDEALPVSKDLKKHALNSLVFEIRFPETFPHAPPFFRILKPRFLPFIQGGGGHITGGGSMCMDLLTSDGWLPSYSISAILLQIKLAISNLDPRPARLASNWNTPYSVVEALAGYKRAAAAHGWKVPQGIDKLVQ